MSDESADFSMQEKPHEAVWYGTEWHRKRDYAFRHCKVCGASEDVHIGMAERWVGGTE